MSLTVYTRLGRKTNPKNSLCERHAGTGDCYIIIVQVPVPVCSHACSHMERVHALSGRHTAA